jgi:peptidoglycan/xylan/chitin deacetylase (PgdA/CDA1 family)
VNPPVLIPFYHLVSDEAPAHIRHLYQPKTIRQFEGDIQYLSSHFKAISLSEFKLIIKKRANPEGQSILLTFDDGLSECYHIVAPILEKFGFTATFFLNSAFVENKGLFYRYKVSLILDFLDQNPKVNEKAKRFLGLQSDQILAQVLKKMGYADTPQIDALAGELELDFEDYLLKNKPYMDKEMILDLNRRGFSFGSHSHDHPYMHLLPENQQTEQVTKSVVLLESDLGIPIESFAFPFTDHGVRGSSIQKWHREGLIKLSFGTSGIRPDQIQNHFQRFSLEQGQHSARRIIFKEKWKAGLRKILGFNTLRAER